MKKGFINLFTLLVLNEQPTHGYHIKKLIEERTFGGWSPTDSTMYTILKELRDKDLIEESIDQDPDDSRKTYQLTENGKKMLSVMKEKEKAMRDSLNAIIFTTTDGNKNFLDRSIYDILLRGPPHSFNNFSKDNPFEDHIFPHPMMRGHSDFLNERLKEKSPQKQAKILNFRKKFLTQQISRMTQHLEQIDKKLSELKL